MRRSKKKYKRPKMLWNTERIEADKILKIKFGLVRKKEIWSAQTLLRKYRRMARKLVGVRNKEDEKTLIERLVKLGIIEKGDELDNILGLNVEDILERRLQTVVFKKGLANTPKQARQMIVHGHIRLGNRRTSSPSRLVLKKEENLLEVSSKMNKGV